MCTVFGFASACVPMDKDTGLILAMDIPLIWLHSTTYCYEATWLTEDNCANGFDYLENGCPTTGMVGECEVNAGGDYEGAATGYYYEGQTDPEIACWDYGNGGICSLNKSIT